MTQLLFILTIILSLTTSTKLTCNKSTTYSNVDTTKSFKIDNYWLTPKETFDFSSTGTSSNDTLHLITCCNYVYFPFGKLTDKSSISTSLLSDFKITSSKRDTFTNTIITPPFFQWYETINLELADNKLILFLDNDPEASTHGNIRGGQIVDSKVSFSDNIKVGMSIEDFYKKFFDYFPTELNKKYNVVVIESCVMDITHIYTFKNGLLCSVKFISE